LRKFDTKKISGFRYPSPPRPTNPAPSWVLLRIRADLRAFRSIQERFWGFLSASCSISQRFGEHFVPFFSRSRG
jgi:hypothetical protein